MKQKNIYKYMIIFVASIFSFCLFSLNVYAKPSISSVVEVNNKDIVRVFASGGESKIVGYYVSSSTNISNAMFIPSNLTEINISLMGGQQYIWVKDANGELSDPYSIVMENSCIEEAVPKNATSEGRFKKCGVYANNMSGVVNNESIEGLCASGYSLEYINSSNVCNTLNSNSLLQYDVGYRYCQITYSYKCAKAEETPVTPPQNKTSYLNSLSISSGTLSPAFNKTTYNYTASVNVSAVTINAALSNDGSTFVDGYGPKTYNLNYGLNTIYVKIKSSTGNITTYTLKITRVDNRNNDNSLNSITTNIGTLTPTFNKGVVSYSINVGKDVNTITINATVNNSKATFVSGYGPRTVKLSEGGNKVELKVKSESGATKTYTINVIKEKKTQDPVTPDDKSKLSLLESIELSSGNINFSEKTQEYTVYVGYEITQVIAKAKAKDSSDKVTVRGGENLEVGVENPIVIEVYNAKNKYTRTYTINVIRKEENLTVSSNSKLSSLKIKGHSIKFDKDKTEYKIMLSKNETELNIDAKADDDKSIINIQGNESLKKDSEIVIEVKAEDGTVTNYIIKIEGVSKGVNVFLVVILIIIIIIIVGYMVLRIMGYKVYFNFSLIGSFFRSIGEKIKNIFDR